jgi:Dolichyl-phosphate-mannose-protein mannosyltransferase
MRNHAALLTVADSPDPQAKPDGKKLWKAVLTIAAVGLIANILLISIPGFYSHDELDWQNRIARNNYPWSFGLGNFVTSPFFRLLGTIFISASLRIPLQPLGAHLVNVLLATATACLLYHAVALFRPDRALAAAILFLLMPGFAYSAAWVAAGFDLQFTFLGVASVLCAIKYWRGGARLYLVASLAAFAVALGCKETALSIPVCAALVLYIDRDRVDRRRLTNLAASAATLIIIYVGLNSIRILRMATSGGGGYRLGDGPQILKNILAYFGFPFAAKIVEIQGFPFWDPRQALRLILPHLVLIALIMWRAGPRWAAIYLIAFYATLLPVLSISKFETQYTYASSVALAVALALVWERKWFVAVPVTVLTLILIAHGLTIQQEMYRTGVCQTRALATLKAVLPDAPPDAPLTVLIQDDTPWWVIARAVHDNSFPLRGKFAEVTVTHDPDKAGMAFHADCSVSLR